VSVITDITGVGTVTDLDGEFYLKCDNAVWRVTFSSVGFKSRQFKVNDLPEVIILELLYYKGSDIIVHASRVGSETAVAFENFSREKIKRDYTVSEFPLLLETTPNLYSYAEAGSPLGATSVRIRGFDDKRIVTYINGVPLNDPEDQSTYFVDLPDFAANISDIQVQRGVGNSLYGDASFGGAINVITNTLNEQRQVVLTTGYGEYTSDGESVGGIYKQSVEYTSGLIDGRWSFGGRFSKQKSGGYRYNSWYDGWSYYFTLARLDPRMTTEINIYGGPIRYHAAWYGHTREEIEEDRRINSGIAGYEDLTYENATDNFNQPHYQIHNTYKINERTTLSNTLYYIRGKGYYEQLKPYHLHRRRGKR